MLGNTCLKPCPVRTTQPLELKVSALLYTCATCAIHALSRVGLWKVSSYTHLQASKQIQFTSNKIIQLASLLHCVSESVGCSPSLSFWPLPKFTKIYFSNHTSEEDTIFAVEMTAIVHLKLRCCRNYSENLPSVLQSKITHCMQRWSVKTSLPVDLGESSLCPG